MFCAKHSRQPNSIANLVIGAAAVCAMLIGIAPAWAATTYQVGSARTYKTLASLPSLAAGDVVEIDSGTYNEVKRWQTSGTAANPITIRGVGASRPIFDATGKDVSGSGTPRGVFQIEGDYITIENLQFKKAANAAHNGAGVRVTGGDNVTIRNCLLTNSDMGLMSDNQTGLLVDRCEIASNGSSQFQGYSHNVYVSGTSVSFKGCYIHDATYGQNVKSRAHYTELLYNRIANSQDGEIGLVDAAGDTTTANSNAVMIGNVVVSKVRGGNWNTNRFIEFGQDGGNAHSGTLAVYNNTFVAGDTSNDFLLASSSSASIVAKNNIFYGSNTIVGTGAGTVTGTDNWVATTATVPSGLTSSTKSTSPGFQNLAGGDYHLTSSSACIDQGAGSLTYLDGTGVSRVGTPTLQYVYDLSTATRTNIGTLDIGAYEVPEPGCVGLMLAVAGVGLLRRRGRARV